MSGNTSSGNSRAIAFLLVGVIASVSAIVVLYRLIQTYEERIAEANRPEDTVTVIVAARELFQGVMITEEDIRAVDIPPAYLPAVEKKGVYYTSAQQVVGRTPRERILPNDFLRPDRLADAETGQGLNAIIPPNMRAISVNVRDGQALSGMLNPGDLVDVVVTIKPQDGQDRTQQTRTMVQAVRVLAVNDKADILARAEKTEDGKDGTKRRRRRVRPTVTLAVFPDQAEQVAHAEKEGEITLTLRNAQDHEFADREGTTGIDDVLGIVRPPPVVKPKVVAAPPPPEEPGPTLQINRGTRTEFVEIDEEEAAADLP